jgi:hypothetical protein
MLLANRDQPALAALFAAAVAACGAGAPRQGTDSKEVAAPGPPIPLSETRPYFVPGEQMRYELSLRGVLVGEATLAAGDPGEIDGRPTIIVRSRVESAGVVALLKEVRDDVTSWIDLRSGLPVYYHADVRFGDRAAVIETRFNGGRSGSFVVHHGPPGEERRRSFHQVMPADQGALDGHAVIGALRGWDPPDGGSSTFYVLAGRRVWENTVRLSGREEMRVAIGKFTALRIDGVARRVTRTLGDDRGKEPRTYSIWISDDEDRLPLLVSGKTEFGSVKAELTSYERPDLPAVSRR